MDNEIDPNVPIGTLAVDDIPDTNVKQFLLPGARNGDLDLLSGKQMKVIVTWAQNTLPGDTTFEKAVANARGKFVKGNQRDWNIVSGIVDSDRAANADNPLTPQQNNLMITILTALDSGPDRKPHWDAQIERKIGELPPVIRKKWYEKLATLDTRGEFSTFMDRFNALCGTPAPAPNDMDIEKIAADMQQAADDADDDNEPF